MLQSKDQLAAKAKLAAPEDVDDIELFEEDSDYNEDANDIELEDDITTFEDENSTGNVSFCAVRFMTLF